MNDERTSPALKLARRRAVGATLLAAQHAREHGDAEGEQVAVDLLLHAAEAERVRDLTDLESAARELDARQTGGRPEDESG